MILDHECTYSDQQAITVSTPSTNVLDAGTQYNFAEGKPIPLIAQVTQAFAGGTSIQASIQTCASSSFASGVTTIATGPVIPVASLVPGADLGLPYTLPDGTLEFTQIYYTVVGTMTAGKVTSGFVLNRQSKPNR